MSMATTQSTYHLTTSRGTCLTLADGYSDAEGKVLRAFGIRGQGVRIIATMKVDAAVAATLGATQHLTWLEGGR